MGIPTVLTGPVYNDPISPVVGEYSDHFCPVTATLLRIILKWHLMIDRPAQDTAGGLPLGSTQVPPDLPPNPPDHPDSQDSPDPSESPDASFTTESLLEPVRSVTIDVEEYFHIEAAYGTVARDEWDHWPSRVERNIDLLLTIFDRHKQHGTFFILGDIAKRHPHLASHIANAGHEIASHGTGHDRLHRLNAESFRQDLLTSKHLLEDQTGKPVIGYRAPTFSVVPQTAWAIDVLIESGFRYDASIFPVRHPWYGVPSAPDRPFLVSSGIGTQQQTLLEIPPLTWSIRRGPFRGKHLPVAGGGYFRLLPLWFMRRGLAQAAKEGRPAILYFHPWEFDPHTPRMPLPPLGRIRTYTGLRSALDRLDSIMRLNSRWVRLIDQLDTWSDSARSQTPFSLKAAPM